MRPKNRKEGSNLGRAAIDWNAAFTVFAGLPPQQRTYAAVATHFGVSRRTVETHGRHERWYERARDIDREATTIAERRVGKARADQIAEVLELIGGSLAAYRGQLEDGVVRVRPGDLSRLVKLLNDLSVEETDPPDPELPAAPAPTVEHMTAVLAGLYEAIGDPGQQLADPEHQDEE